MARFERNPQWLADFIGSDPVREVLDEKAEQVEVAAKGIALEHADTGHFAESIHHTRGKYGSGRAYGRVYSDDDASLSIEFGTHQSTPVRALGRAIRSI
ncbi:MAG: hypothetical protein ACRDVE_15670 [Actinocrinis sp.]